jgi:hypothetical protein
MVDPARLSRFESTYGLRESGLVATVRAVFVCRSCGKPFDGNLLVGAIGSPRNEGGNSVVVEEGQSACPTCSGESR